MQKGKIIILNGAAGSGKTTIIRKLQEQLAEPFYALSLDTFINMTPQRFFSDPDGRSVVNRAVSILPYTVKQFSDMGLNTIVEHVFMKIDKLIDEFVELLHEYPLLFIHVTCPLEEHRQRLTERGGNPDTVLEWQLPLIIPQDTYDLTIDSTQEKCIDEIKNFLDYPEKFKAFKTLWSQHTAYK